VCGDTDPALEELWGGAFILYPVVWSREYGLGRVVRISIGHAEETRELEAYKRLMLPSMHWMITA